MTRREGVPSYSILICTHNRAPVLREALANVDRLALPDGASVEVVVVNNASTDATEQVVREHAASARFPTKYVVEPRLGLSAARNAGLRACTGERIAFTDDDGFPERDWLLQYDAAFARHEIDWAFGPVIPRWPGKQPSWYGPEVRHYFAALDYGEQQFEARFLEHQFYGVNNCCERAKILELGDFREDQGNVGPDGVMGTVGDDTDIFIRALRAGFCVRYLPEPKVHHLIAENRCTRLYHLRRIWRAQPNFLAALLASPPPGPTLLGLPRFYYRSLASHFARSILAACRLRSSAATYHFFQTVRFVGLAYRALRARLRRPARLPARSLESAP